MVELLQEHLSLLKKQTRSTGKDTALPDLFKGRKGYARCKNKECDGVMLAGHEDPQFSADFAVLPDEPELDDVYFVPYTIGMNSRNIMRMLQVRKTHTESIADLLEFCKLAYQFADKDRYLVASVADNEIVRIHPLEEKWQDM